MKKIIKKWGNSLVITFDQEDSIIYDMKEGDVIDLKINYIQDGDRPDQQTSAEESGYVADAGKSLVKSPESPSYNFSCSHVKKGDKK